MRILSVRSAAAGLCVAGVGLAAAQQPPAPAPAPAPEPTLVSPQSKDYGSRPVAYIYGSTPVTRADLAEFLIARGGYEKVELLVNKMIIETEAKRRGITVTPIEMEAALAEDIKGINVKKEDFVSVVLPKYGKTLYEWMEDVVRPKLLLTKMCKDKVTVADADLQVEYERQYGEKRAVQVIIWPSTDPHKKIFELWDTIRKSDEEFTRLARTQANPALAAVAGKIKPIHKHLDAPSKIVEETAFALKPGEVSQILETPQGYMVMKLLAVVPPSDKVTFAAVRQQLHHEVMDQKVSAEIPKQFAELAKAANPTVLLKGPPPEWQFTQTNRQIVDQFKQQQEPANTGVVPAGGKR